ncbi:hypothetical protein [Methyloligella solikamskensis]|uniref:Uncharacterized protein n=1 Tax=Methyloligella solikamskensis TaxID=1177756 RepID=A0ABW3J8D9_9HYPH
MSDEPRQNWDVRILEKWIAERSGSANTEPGVEEVLVAFARWKSWEGSYEIGAAQEKERLDRLLNRLPPERWDDLKELVGQVDDGLLLEVMHYSAQNALAESKQMVRDLENATEASDRDADKSRSEPDGDQGGEPRM